MKILYYSLIHSHLSYGNLAWGNATQSALRQTILLQKRDLHLINNAKYNSHTDPIFRSSRILKLADLVEYQGALFALILILRNYQYRLMTFSHLIEPIAPRQDSLTIYM